MRLVDVKVNLTRFRMFHQKLPEEVVTPKYHFRSRALIHANLA